MLFEPRLGGFEGVLQVHGGEFQAAGTASSKALGQGTPGRSEEKPGSQYGWRRVNGAGGQGEARSRQ